MYMNSTEQSSKMTQTTGESTEGRRADWIDLSGHESLTPPLTVVTEADAEDSAEDSSSDSAQEDAGENNVSDNDSNEEEERDEEDEQSDENERSEEERDEEDEQSDEESSDEDNTIPGDWVCVVYDRDYWNETGNKYLFTGMVTEENDRWVEVDCGEEEGTHVFHKCDSFLDFSRNTYTDRFGWTVRIHRVEFDYDTCRIVDKTAHKNWENAFQVPTKLEMPGVVALGYIFFISLVAPMFHALSKPRNYVIEEL